MELKKENGIVEIREENLEDVTGGNYLSADEVKEMEFGRRLMIEGNFGNDIALVSYLGDWRDPGAGSMIQAHVRIIEIYDRGVYKHGDTFSSWVGERFLAVGDELYVSRYYLDFAERA